MAIIESFCLCKGQLSKVFVYVKKKRIPACSVGNVLLFLSIISYSRLKKKALESAYTEVVTQDIPVWGENTDLLNWLQDFCR